MDAPHRAARRASEWIGWVPGALRGEAVEVSVVPTENKLLKAMQAGDGKVVVPKSKANLQERAAAVHIPPPPSEGLIDPSLGGGVSNRLPPEEIWHMRNPPPDVGRILSSIAKMFGVDGVTQRRFDHIHRLGWISSAARAGPGRGTNPAETVDVYEYRFRRSSASE